jgi:phosphatidylserine/phosphatidylglycerophosphate/cardiolipin synthase-like enzyme
MKAIKDESAKARSIKVAAHRFSHQELIATMINSHNEGKLVQFVSDDDIHWTGVRNIKTGFNTYGEFLNVLKLVKAGIEVKYMETNQNFRFLHHNKYILFEGSCEAEAVFAGAGNFTKSAFYKNFENYYMIKIPSVVKAFKKQYNHVFYKLATSFEMMPSQYVMP